MRLSKEQAEKIFKQNLKYIKRSIKKKISLYEPLDYKTAYNGFIQWIKDEDFKVIREIPMDGEVENHLNELIKNFLIKNAYYELAEKYIQRIIMNKLGISDTNEIRVLEIGDFIRERLEKEELKKLKTFKEKSKFKTYLTAAVFRLLIDFWRHKSHEEEKVTKHEPEIEKSLHRPPDDPLTVLIKTEDEAFKKKAVEFLPQILDKLDFKEKLVIQLKYEKDMKISAIARTLGRTRFLTAQFIKQIERRISTEILGGSHEASRR
jgi:RNA polymerase sigma factor (sigma-70 family)